MKERTTIYLSPTLREQIDASAQEKGQTLSVWIERACLAALQAPKESVKHLEQ